MYQYFIPFFDCEISYYIDDQILFICSLVDGHLDGLYFLAIMNNMAVNFQVQVFVWTYVCTSLGDIPRSGIAGSYGSFA